MKKVTIIQKDKEEKEEGENKQYAAISNSNNQNKNEIITLLFYLHFFPVLILNFNYFIHEMAKWLDTYESKRQLQHTFHFVHFSFFSIKLMIVAFNRKAAPFIFHSVTFAASNNKNPTKKTHTKNPFWIFHAITPKR